MSSSKAEGTGHLTLDLPAGAPEKNRMRSMQAARLAVFLALAVPAVAPAKPRARELGIPFDGRPGLHNAITDVAGVPVGREITGWMPELNSPQPEIEGNSIIVVVATDAPLLPHQLKRLCRRVPLGLAKVGGFGSHSSGDLFLAFSTAAATATDREDVSRFGMLANEAIDPLLLATVQATEEAIVNALVAAETMTGINGNKVHALPHERLVGVMRSYGRLRE
jgi:L-aminopeptidase/D-esterase-like protein